MRQGLYRDAWLAGVGFRAGESKVLQIARGLELALSCSRSEGLERNEEGCSGV